MSDQAPTNQVTVQIGERGLAARVQAAGHELHADEPVADGGTATGPDPYGYLLAALGSCTVMTLRLYADRKGWPLHAATARLSHSRVWAKDCEDCETKTGRVDVIQREIALEGPLDDEQRARLMEIADRCPVHRTLTGEIKVRTRSLEA
jgi:putative redox protein